MMVAVNDGTGLQYLLTDHLGSTVAVTNSSGTLTSQQRYLPFGAPRTIPNSPILGTDFTYTGQRKLDDGMGGIMDYRARFYSPALGRFLQPDSIIPYPVFSQSWNRFSYVINNPIRYNDPTGHRCEPGDYEPGGYCYSSSRSIAPPPPGISYERDKRLRTLRLKAEILSESLQADEISDTEVLEELFDYAADVYGDDVDGALQDLGIVVGGLDTTGNIPRQINERDPNDPFALYYIGYAAFVPHQTTFALYLNPNNDNQVRHFLAGVAGGNANTGRAGRAFLWWQEGAPEDRALYGQAFQLVDFIVGNPRFGQIGHPLSDVSNWVRQNLTP